MQEHCGICQNIHFCGDLFFLSRKSNLLSLNIFYCQSQRGRATSSDNINYSMSPSYLLTKKNWFTAVLELSCVNC